MHKTILVQSLIRLIYRVGISEG
uniref:Uncharacterized protein n=1 Tax=Anguilla anguilla TaxID=7936 RepID=A0A0E9XRQ4_ANGAN